jgi:hypothetical protein
VGGAVAATGRELAPAPYLHASRTWVTRRDALNVMSSRRQSGELGARDNAPQPSQYW